MRHTWLLLFLLAIGTGHLAAQDRSIINPAYEFKTSGLYQIQKIEADAEETRLHVLCTFIPGWWINFSDQTFIKDSGSDEPLYINGMDGGTIGERITMPASGDSAVVLKFPPLAPATTRIDFGEDGKEVIFGLSFSEMSAETGVPDAITQWLAAEVGKSKTTQLADYASDAFFSTDTARIVGYINGYDPRAGFSTGMIYARNAITREDYPIVVQIHEDGRFEADLPMQHPIYSAIVFERNWIAFYIEPGQTLSVTFNWEEFLEADRQRNIRYKFQDIVFGGPAAQINHELAQAQTTLPDYRALEQKIKQMHPAAFKLEQIEAWEKESVLLEQQLASHNWLPQTKTLLRNELALAYSNYLYDFLMNRGHYARQDSTNEVLKAPVDPTYYDFVSSLNVNDPSLLVSSHFSTFINRFEYSTPFFAARQSVRIHVEKSFSDFLQQDRNMELSDMDVEFFATEQKARAYMLSTMAKGGVVADSVVQSIMAEASESPRSCL